MFVSFLNGNRLPNAVVGFMRLSKGHCHCHLLSGYLRRLLNNSDTRRTTQTLTKPGLIDQVRKETLCITRVVVWIRWDRQVCLSFTLQMMFASVQGTQI